MQYLKSTFFVLQICPLLFHLTQPHVTYLFANFRSIVRNTRGVARRQQSGLNGVSQGEAWVGSAVRQQVFLSGLRRRADSFVCKCTLIAWDNILYAAWQHIRRLFISDHTTGHSFAHALHENCRLSNKQHITSQNLKALSLQHIVSASFDAEVHLKINFSS